ncbi:glycosyltransferase family protein [Dactylosporangium darangshiense]|uniref:hypothetical protein n=1 Tax=Dactylosporangium darangshiense TaxID=579108 RepID=UPI0036298FC3
MTEPFEIPVFGRSWARLESYSRLAGPLNPPPAGKPYRVRYRAQRKVDGRRRVVGSVLIAVFNICFEVIFCVWLLQPAHFAQTNPGPIAEAAGIANVFVICSIAIVELLRLVNVLSLSLASMTARDPVPVTPDPKLRLAFLTTIVPSKEPIAVVRDTLRAAKRIRHRGVFDIWLLDEGDDDDVKAMCESWASGTSRATGSAGTTGRRGRSGRGPSTATTTRGWTRTATTTTCCSPSTPTTCRWPTSPSGSSATSATPTWRTRSDRSATRTARRS